jgi:hypothetical protein
MTSRRGFFGVIAGAVAGAAVAPKVVAAIPEVSVASVWNNTVIDVPVTMTYKAVNYGYSLELTPEMLSANYRLRPERIDHMNTSGTFPQLTTGKKKGGKKGPGGRSC